jgi:hypothetical protein
MTTNYKQPKLFGKDEDGEYLAMIEQIGTGQYEDTLYISNRKPNLYIFSIFNGYRQIGIFKTNDHTFIEGEYVIVTKKEGKIVSCKEDKIKQ